MKPTLSNITLLYGNPKPSSVDFSNFSLYESCTKKYEKYVEKILKLNSIFNSARITSNEPRKELAFLLENWETKPIEEITENINTEHILSKATTQEISPIPNCLASVITGENIKDSDTGIDVLDPNNTLINEYNSLTNSASEDIKKTLEKRTTEEKSNDLSLYIDKLMKSIVDPRLYKLFILIDTLQKFIIKTKFIITYRDFKDYYDCLTKNCIPYGPYTPDDYFLWYDEGKTDFILPIDINNGEVRVKKIYSNPNEEEKQIIKNIEQNYLNYKKTKTKILKDLYNKLKVAGVEDKDNPFKLMLEEIEIKYSINTLF